MWDMKLVVRTQEQGLSGPPSTLHETSPRILCSPSTSLRILFMRWKPYDVPIQRGSQREDGGEHTCLGRVGSKKEMDLMHLIKTAQHSGQGAEQTKLAIWAWQTRLRQSNVRVGALFTKNPKEMNLELESRPWTRGDVTFSFSTFLTCKTDYLSVPNSFALLVISLGLFTTPVCSWPFTPSAIGLGYVLQQCLADP